MYFNLFQQSSHLIFHSEFQNCSESEMRNELISIRFTFTYFFGNHNYETECQLKPRYPQSSTTTAKLRLMTQVKGQWYAQHIRYAKALI